MSEIINDVSYSTFEDLLSQSDLSDIEIAEMKFHTEIVGAMIQARLSKNLTQKELESISGVSQPLIARIEKGKTNSQVTTLIRILDPMGFKLSVVPK